jgi:hypothetical protein
MRQPGPEPECRAPPPEGKLRAAGMRRVLTFEFTCQNWLHVQETLGEK